MSEIPRKRLLEWMRRVLDMHGWTASVWCKKAGISPTVVTRFMSNEAASIPSMSSIYKLSAVVGFGPDFFAKRMIPLLSSCLEIQAWIKQGSLSKNTAWVHVGDELSLGTFALKVKSLNVLNRGISSGSVVIVNPDRAAAPGDVVLASLEDGQSPELFIFKPPYLEPDTPASPPITRPLEGSMIIGVVVRLIVDLVQDSERASERANARAMIT